MKNESVQIFAGAYKETKINITFKTVIYLKTIRGAYLKGRNNIFFFKCTLTDKMNIAEKD